MPCEMVYRGVDKVSPEDEIVISGIAGRFPDSDNVKHLEYNLMNKIDLVTGDDRRWNLSELQRVKCESISYKKYQ